MKTCPYCAEQIQDEAIKCRFCGSVLLPAPPNAPASTPTAPPNAPAADQDDQPLQYTHSGRRYLLGYGTTFFGIWDRQESSRPISRFPRTDEGWRAAWLAFSADEPNSVQVGLGPAGAGAPGLQATPLAPTTQRRVSAAWWLLPIFMGWLGGLIAWLVNKDVDPQAARAMLITGIVISVALFLLFASVFASVDRL